MKIHTVTPQFVQHLPEQLEEGVFYVCEDFHLTAHKCCCGCGEDVYNKLSPAHWRLIKTADGRVSLHPSIGNWNYACCSHYWIRNNQVFDAGRMSARRIKAVQRSDRRDRDRYIAHVNRRDDAIKDQKLNLWQRFRRLLARTMHRVKSIWPW